MHGRCDGNKRVTAMFSRNFASITSEGNIGDAAEQEEMLCDKVKIEREFTHLGNRVSVGGRCEAFVTTKTRCGYVKCSECGQLITLKKVSCKAEMGCFQELCKTNNL